MGIEELRQALPDHAKDLKLNLSNLLGGTELNQQQLRGAILATAIASRNQLVVAAAREDAAGNLPAEVISTVEGVTAVMAMNNVYYRFTHLVEKPEYAAMPARLRMTALASGGAPSLDIELWSLAVSAVNGCGRCIVAHERQLISKGATREMVHTAVRVASVIYAMAVTCDAAVTADVAG